MIRAGVAVVVAFLAPLPALGQGVVSVRKASRNEIGFRFTHLAYRGRESRGAVRLGYREWVRVGIQGVVVDPTVADFRLVLSPTFAQSNADAEGGLPNSSDRNLGLALSARLFPSGMFSASLNATRSSGTARTGIGTETQVTGGSFGGTVEFRDRLFPADLDYRRTSREQVWVDGGSLVTENLATERIRLTAGNRKARVLVERNLSNNRISGGTLSTNRVEAHHTTRWGKGSRSRSTLMFVRGGLSWPAGAPGFNGSTFERFDWNENLHLQHTTNVGSDLRYRRGWGRANGNTTNRTDAEAILRARVLPRLSAAIGATSRSASFDGGSVGGFVFSPSVAFGTRIPGGGDFSTSLSVGLEHSRSTPGDEGWITVVDERHVVDASRRFTLENPAVDAVSVTVTSADRSRIFDAGIDFRLVESPPFLDVVVPPGGRIATGDTLLVNYRYQPFPETSDLSLRAAYSATLSFPTIRLYYRRSLRSGQDDAPSGQTGGAVRLANVRDRDDQVLGIGITRATPVGTMDLMAERRLFEFGDEYGTTTYTVRGTVGVPLPGNAHGALGASLGHTKGTDGLVQKVVSVTSSATWIPLSGLRLEGSLVSWNWRQNGRRQQTVGGVLDAEWRLGYTSVVLQYSSNHSEDEIRQTNTSRLATYVVRTF